MDKKTIKKIETNVDSGPIWYLDREWPEYRARVALVLDEFEAILGQPLLHAITNAGYRGDRSETEYMYSHIAPRLSLKVDGMAYYAITGNPEKIAEDYDVDDPAKFWMESLDAIKHSIKKSDIMEALKGLDHMLRYSIDEITEIDMFAMKAIGIIQKKTAR
jgi:hypothetical protein